MFGIAFQGGKQAFQLYTRMLDSLIAFLGSDVEYLLNRQSIVHPRNHLTMVFLETVGHPR